jgi:hypothetical protein
MIKLKPNNEKVSKKNKNKIPRSIAKQTNSKESNEKRSKVEEKSKKKNTLYKSTLNIIQQQLHQSIIQYK